mmetsp:Transcript_75074/g.244089  ORF Transcript_75074/g.244089 Transcript_75074/m.244089 type:complete len:585 (+) Transcript_75074:2575-4329(+)
MFDGQHLYAQEVLSELHCLAELLAEEQKLVHGEVASVQSLKEEGRLQAGHEQMRVSGAVLLDDHLQRPVCLLRNNLRLLLQRVQERLETLRQVRQKGLCADVADGLEESETASLGLVGLALRDTWQHGLVEDVRQQVPSGEQDLGQAAPGAAALHLGDVLVGRVALELLQQKRHDLLIAHNRKPYAQAAKALAGLMLDLLRRVHEAILKQRHQLLNVGDEQFGVRDEVHRSADDLHAPHLRVVCLLAHGAGDDGEDEAEGARIDRVHEGGVGQLVQRICGLLHVGTVQDAVDDLVRHGPDLRGACDFQTHVPQQDLSLLLHLLPRVTDGIAHRHHDLRHQEAQLLGRGVRLAHPLDHVLQDGHASNLDLPLAGRSSAQVFQQHWNNELGHALASRATLGELLAEVHSGATRLRLELDLLQEHQHRGHAVQHRGRVPQQRPDGAQGEIARRHTLELFLDALDSSGNHGRHLSLDLALVSAGARARLKPLHGLLAAFGRAPDHGHDLGVALEGPSLCRLGLPRLRGLLRQGRHGVTLLGLHRQASCHQGLLVRFLLCHSACVPIFLLELSHVAQSCAVVAIQRQEL